MERDYSAVPVHRLADEVRAEYRAIFVKQVAEGRLRPFVIPYSVIVALLVPALWLAIPQSRHGWMRQATWPVAALVVGFNLEVIRSTSSTNMAIAYISGIVSFWSILSTMNVLVWTKPQLNAARVVKRSESPPPPATAEIDSTGNGHAQHPEPPHLNGNGNGTISGSEVRQRHMNGIESKVPSSASSHLANRNKRVEHHYVWERFPTDGSFAERFQWALDFTTKFRYSGWNYSISAIPRPSLPTPELISDGSAVDMSTMPITTPAGYQRCVSNHDLLFSRTTSLAFQLVVMDFLVVYGTMDPYFVLGPDPVHPPLPPHLQGLSFWSLRLYRQAFSAAAVLSAITAIFSLNDLVQFYLISYIFPARGELWQHSSTFGSIIQVLDNGIAGGWGAWWHQSFRAQFAAPARWLIREGYMRRGTLTATIAALLISFLQSGLLHACGSVSSIPKTKVWRTPVFFFLQVVGILLQQGLAQTFVTYFPQLHRRMPRAAKRTWNGLSTAAWLYLTADFFADDVASAGLWLLEPVPFSLFRMLGFGYHGDRWWRWDEHHLLKWYSGDHWWQSGVAL